MVLIVLKFCISPPDILDERARGLFVVPLWYRVYVVPCNVMLMWLDTFCELCVFAWLLMVWVFLIHKLKVKLYLCMLEGLQGGYSYSCTHS